MKKITGIIVAMLALTLLLFAQEEPRKVKSQHTIQLQTKKPNFTLMLDRESTGKTSDTNAIMIQIFKNSNKMLTK
jgi:hypothetical protein